MPPAGRFVLVNGIEAWAEASSGSFALSSQAYAPDTIHPDGASRIESFSEDPWPRWTFRLEDGTRIEHEVFVSRERGVTVLAWRLTEPRPDVSLSVRPLLSGRDYHALHHENPAFRFDGQAPAPRIVWRPYDGVPAVAATSNGEYRHAPLWYRNFLYAEERARGLDFTEDLASPGTFVFDLSRGEAVLVLEAMTPGGALLEPPEDALTLVRSLSAREERRRRAFASRLERAADDYLVSRGEGRTIVAGYPWFTDWGRDTFIALRGLCLATDRLDDAREILLAWAGTVSEGMLPNRFPDRGDEPEFNSVDASLWYVVAVHEFLQASQRPGRRLRPADRSVLEESVGKILTGYAGGTRYGIRAEEDGLLAAGVAGVQLTWMDAKVGDRVITPRIGKPVEVEALWVNALRIGSDFSPRWGQLAAKACASFGARFWNGRDGILYDVVDCDHEAGKADPTFRPNQIFAVGGLPFPLLSGARAARIVDAVEVRLWTPLGLRSLSPDDPSYTGRYRGGVAERDGAYHQGTVWPWLLGAFVEAWVRVRGATPESKRAARRRFLDPLLRHVEEAGLGHVSEIAEGDPPHRPRGCPFQAWSVGEALRLDRMLA
jgi:predicted glycogen debranching enzyme